MYFHSVHNFSTVSLYCLLSTEKEKDIFNLKIIYIIYRGNGKVLIISVLKYVNERSFPYGFHRRDRMDKTGFLVPD